MSIHCLAAVSEPVVKTKPDPAAVRTINLFALPVVATVAPYLGSGVGGKKGGGFIKVLPNQ